LAAQASQAAESITELISSMQEQAEQTINSIDLGNQQVDNGLQAIKSVEDAFYQAASAEESVQTQVEQFNKTLTQIAAYSDLIIASTRNIESRSENGLNDARGIANATQEQLANIRQIRQELASLQHTAEQLRDLGNT
jgi:methyl-accepting chemotaxis protein